MITIHRIAGKNDTEGQKCVPRRAETNANRSNYKQRAKRNEKERNAHRDAYRGAQTQETASKKKSNDKGTKYVLRRADMKRQKEVASKKAKTNEGKRCVVTLGNERKPLTKEVASKKTAKKSEWQQLRFAKRRNERKPNKARATKISNNQR